MVSIEEDGDPEAIASESPSLKAIINKSPDLKMALKLAALFAAILVADIVVALAFFLLYISYVMVIDHQTFIHAILYFGYYYDTHNIWIEFTFMLLAGVLSAGIAWLFLTRVDKEKASLEAFGLGIDGDAGKRLLAGLMQCLVFFGLYYGLLLLLGITGIVSYGMDFNSPGFILPFALIAAGSLASGFGCEVLYRGYVQTILAKKYDFIRAILLSSIFYTVVMEFTSILTGKIYPLSILTVFLTGLILGYLFYATRSLWACGAFNSVQTFMISLVFVIGALPLSSPPSYYPTVTTYPTAMFVIRASEPVSVFGITLGAWSNVVYLVVGTATLFVLVAYYQYQQKLEQDEAEEAEKEGATI